MTAPLPLQAHDPRQIGPYRLLGRLGAGGMGQVYLGEGPRSELAAVKVVHTGLAEDDRFRARFRHEVAIGRRVVGPWTAAVLDADPDAPEPWLATEYVAAPTLDAAVRAAGPLPPGSVEVLAAGLARALVAVHGPGLVHRDIKPSNVLLAADRPRLIDFGISRAIDGTRMTSTGTTVGTPAFMSPEQAAGEPVGPASDVFSLGGLLVMAATGTGPFGEGTPLVVLRRILTDSPDLGALTEPLRSVVAGCLSRNAVDRPVAVELVERLPFAPPDGGWLPPTVRALVPPSPTPTEPVTTRPVRDVTATPDTRESQPGRPPARLLTRRTLLAGLGAVGVIGGGVYWATRPRAELRWTFAAPQQIRTLAVGDGLVYAGGLDASVHALDASTGRLRWTHLIPAAADWLTVAGDIVHAGSYTGGTVALDAVSGRRRWEYQFARVLAATDSVVVTRESGGPTLAGDVVVARDPATGTPLWQRPKHDFTVETGGFDTGTALDGAVHLGLADTLVTLDAASGELRWAQPLGSVGAGAGVRSITASGATVYFENQVERRTVALDAGSGAWRWERAYVPEVSRQLVADAEALYVAEAPMSLAEDSVSAAGASTGETRWSWATQHTVDVSPTVSGNTVYVTTVSYAVREASAAGPYRVHALAADSGGLRWTFDIDGGRPERPLSPVAADGTAFVARDASVFAVTAD